MGSGTTGRPRRGRTAGVGVTFVLLLPRNIAVLLLRAYRATISPLYGEVCRYYPSCSAYTLEAVQRHGLLRGALLGARRILRCHPWARGGVDDVPGHSSDPRYPITRSGLVVADRKA